MLYLAHARFDAVRGQALPRTIATVGLASLGAAAAILLTGTLFASHPGSGSLAALLEVTVRGGVGALVFLALALALRVPELQTILRLIGARLRLSRRVSAQE
jgi:hypothetical protein